MAGETMVTIVGNVASDPQLRTVPGGHEVANFWVASNERRYDQDSGGWVNGRTLRVQVSCWRETAVRANQALRRGDAVLAMGKLRLAEFDRQGETQQRLELEAVAVGPNLRWCGATVARAESSPAVTADGGAEASDDGDRAGPLAAA